MHIFGGRIDGVAAVSSSPQQRGKRPDRCGNNDDRRAAAARASFSSVRPRRQTIRRRVPRVAVPLIWYFLTGDVRYISRQGRAFRLQFIMDDQTPYFCR